MLQLVKVLLQYKKAVPVCIVRRTQHCALPRTATLVVPEVEVEKLQMCDGVQKSTGFEALR